MNKLMYFYIMVICNKIKCLHGYHSLFIKHCLLFNLKGKKRKRKGQGKYVHFGCYTHLSTIKKNVQQPKQFHM